MAFTAALAGIAVIAGLVVFFWHTYGPGSARAFGNRIAAHLGLPRSLFHSLLAHGVRGSARDLLVRLERTHGNLDAACLELAPVLARGIERLEEHFGQQDTVNAIKPIVARWVARADGGA